MGKNNKKGNKANVFKVVGAKSLKKTKAKPVNLGLKNIKQKVQDIDKEFVEINKNPTPSKTQKTEVKGSSKNRESELTKEQVASNHERTTDKLVQMSI